MMMPKGWRAISVAEALGCQMPKVSQTQIQNANCQTPFPSETLHPKKAHDYQSHEALQYPGVLDNLFPWFAQQLTVSQTSLPDVQVLLLLNRPSGVEFGGGFFQNLLCIYYIIFAARSP